MKKFEYFEHTADAKFQAFGKSLEEAFSNAALAVVGLMTNDKVKPKLNKKIKVKGKDLKQLLYNFLEELLFLLDSQNFLLGKIKKINLNVSKTKVFDDPKNQKIFAEKKLVLEAEVIGDSVKNYEIFGDVKAVTYNSMEIKKEKGKFIIQVVVDM